MSTAPASRVADATCSPLLNLPAELREQVYHLAFSPLYRREQPINLLDTRPPTKDLLLVCKQIYREASTIYWTTYRQYWLESTFAIEQRQVTAEKFGHILSYHLSRDHIPLSQIKHLRVITSDSHTWHLVHPGGAWRVERPSGRKRYVCLRGWITSVSPWAIAWIGRESDDELREVVERTPSIHSLMQQILLLPTVDVR